MPKIDTEAERERLDRIFDEIAGKIPEEPKKMPEEPKKTQKENNNQQQPPHCGKGK